MEAKFHPKKINTLLSMCVSFIQILLTVFCYGYHSKYFKNETSFWVSILFPGFFAIFSYFWIFKSSNARYLKLMAISTIVAFLVEAISLYLGIIFFGE